MKNVVYDLPKGNLATAGKIGMAVQRNAPETVINSCKALPADRPVNQHDAVCDGRSGETRLAVAGTATNE